MQRIGTFGFAIALFLATSSVPADAAPRDSSDLVTLQGGFISSQPPGCGSLPNAFSLNRRILADGSRVEFNGVPANQSLVITGINWTIGSTGGLDGGPDTVALHFEYTGVVIYVDVAEPGRVAKSVPLSGLVISAGQGLCFGKSGPWTSALVYVRGYFVPQRP